MTVIYVREQGAVVRRDVDRVRVTKRDRDTTKDRVLAEAPVREVEQVVLYGNIQLTTQAAALLLQHEVDVVFLSLYGTFRGRLLKTGSKFAALRHAQLKLSGDAQRSLQVAKSIVRAKLGNQHHLLYHLAGIVKQEQVAALQKSAQGIDQMQRTCHRATTADALRGYEGKAGAFYFEALGTLLDPAWSFSGRKYYPSPDPFNALLSFGYALLLKDITATIQLVGLDPYLGCLHALEYGRPALALDLMEEFRPLIVDWAMLDLVLAGKLGPTDFTFTNRPERPVELGPALLPEVIRAYENRLSTALTHPPSGALNTLRRTLELQARIYARVAMGQRQDYDGFVAPAAA